MHVDADGTPAGSDPDSDHAMSAEADYHLLLEPDEVPVLRTALDLLVADARDAQILELARAVLARLPADPLGGGPDARVAPGGREPAAWPASVPLEAREMKIVHTAVHLLLDDLQREQADEMQILQSILEKLPDEHAIRAISLD
jgi:hypothetical protein